MAVTAALLAALTFAVAAVLQQAAAAAAPTTQSLHPRLLLSLLRQPLWLAGVGMAAASYVIQGVALAFGPLVLVMPLASTDLLFALPLVAWRQGRRLTPTETIGATCTAGGVAAFLAVLPSGEGTAVPGLADWVPLLIVVVALVAGLLAMGLRTPATVRTGAYAAAAGLLFALLDALTKGAAGLFRNEGLDALTHWEPYALIVVGITGLLLVQSSYQAGSLAISLPVIDTVEPVGSVLMGAAVFREPLATGWALAVQIVAGILAIAGIVILSRSELGEAEADSSATAQRA
ncbi:DMT family transporter [Catenulispora subtropica]|uniref:DMT family transporter n=1 Tax=Catenulispora subtropica TaxID=450798 RepID=A0ABP5EJN2_9ACTN